MRYSEDPCDAYHGEIASLPGAAALLRFGVRFDGATNSPHPTRPAEASRGQ
jgi:hypothetical protein